MLLEIAFGDQGRAHETEFVGHHISFQFEGNIETVNEIPSADTLIFDHDIMWRVFGIESMMVMRRLAVVPADKREARLEEIMKEVGVWQEEKTSGSG